MFGSSLPLFYFYNWQAFQAAIGFALFGMAYPLAKRFTYYPQLVLGICYNSGLFISSLVIQQSVNPLVIPFYIFNVLWTMIYDTVYAK